MGFAVLSLKLDSSRTEMAAHAQAQPSGRLGGDELKFGQGENLCPHLRTELPFTTFIVLFPHIILSTDGSNWPSSPLKPGRRSKKLPQSICALVVTVVSIFTQEPDVRAHSEGSQVLGLPELEAVGSDFSCATCQPCHLEKHYLLTLSFSFVICKREIIICKREITSQSYEV